MTEYKHTPWVRHLDAIGDELMRLSIACEVRLRDPGVVDRIGTEETKLITEAIIERLDRRRELGGTGSRNPAGRSK